jgi:hypothetical protein
MIEKIEKIIELLIIPNVDKLPEMAINQMAILNLLVELRAQIEYQESYSLPFSSICLCGTEEYKETENRADNLSYCSRCDKPY